MLQVEHKQIPNLDFQASVVEVDFKKELYQQLRENSIVHNLLVHMIRISFMLFTAKAFIMNKINLKSNC